MPAFSATPSVEVENPWQHYLLKMHPVRLLPMMTIDSVLTHSTQGLCWLTTSVLLYRHHWINLGEYHLSQHRLEYPTT